MFLLLLFRYFQPLFQGDMIGTYKWEVGLQELEALQADDIFFEWHLMGTFTHLNLPGCNGTCPLNFPLKTHKCVWQ